MKVTVSVDLTPAQLAEVFCAFNDEKQAQFFIECARIAASWEYTGLSQWAAVGRHLRTCGCSSDEARLMVAQIADLASRQPRAASAESQQGGGK